MIESVLPIMSAMTMMTLITGVFIATSLSAEPWPTHNERARLQLSCKADKMSELRARN
jgi:hypothetical protein